jgi:tetratricopeptide (TPR) repeat protein
MIIKHLHSVKKVIILTVFLSAGCVVIKQPVFVKNNKRYCVVKGIFLEEWDDYYERALSCIEGKFYDQALKDLDHAIVQRYHDKRMVNTYGKHYIMDYFPHREKGFVYYKLNDFESAIKELGISLEHVVSSKAAHFLDKSLKARLIKEKLATSVPQITLNQQLPIRTRNNSVFISGTAVDSQYIADILLSGKSIYSASADQTATFKKKLYLKHGSYQFDLTAVNLLGKKSIQTILITVDKMAPMISIQETERFIQGIVYDDSGIELYLNNKLIILSDKKKAEFKILRKNIRDQIHIYAKDQLGNETDVILKPSEICENDHRIAQNFSYIMTDNQTNLITYAKKDSLFKINLKDSQIVYNKEIQLFGTVTARKKVRRIVINNIMLNTEPGKTILFNYPLSLKKGFNLLSLAAFDEKDIQMVVKRLSIVYNIPEILKVKNRYSTTQHVFDHTDGLQKNILFQNQFANNLVKANRFFVQLDQSLEKLFNQKNLFPVMERQKDFYSNSFLFGTIHNSVHGYEVAVRIVGQDRDVLASEDVYSESSDTKTLYDMSCKLAAKVKNCFPMMTGRVTQVNDSGFVAEFKDSEEILNNWPMIIYEDLPQKKDYGTQPEIVAYAKMNKYLHKNQYFFSIYRCIKNRLVKPGDGIITQ